MKILIRSRSMVMMVLYTLYERGQNRAGLKKWRTAGLNQSVLLMTLDNWSKDGLRWEKGSRFVLTGKKKGLWIPSKVIKIRFDRERLSEDRSYRQEKIKKIKQAGNVFPDPSSWRKLLKLTEKEKCLQPELQLVWPINLVGYRVKQHPI